MGRGTRLAPATSGTPETAEPLLLGAPFLNLMIVPRNHSRERSIPREVGGCSSQAPPSKARTSPMTTPMSCFQPSPTPPPVRLSWSAKSDPTVSKAPTTSMTVAVMRIAGVAPACGFTETTPTGQVHDGDHEIGPTTARYQKTALPCAVRSFQVYHGRVRPPALVLIRFRCGPRR